MALRFSLPTSDWVKRAELSFVRPLSWPCALVAPLERTPVGQLLEDQTINLRFRGSRTL